MVKSKQLGFTLIEVTLVLAITGALFAVVWDGQAQLRSQAQFDAAIDKVVASINEARNEATSGVNLVGTGNGQSDSTPACPSTEGTTVFAGTMWAVQSSGATIDYYKATPGSNACSFETDTVDIALPLTVSVVGQPSQPGERVLFVRTGVGENGFAVCQLPLASPSVPSFKDGGCDAPGAAIVSGSPLKLNFSDGRHTSEVDVDASGLAQRAS